MAAACSRQPMATLSPSGMATILTRWVRHLPCFAWFLVGRHPPAQVGQQQTAVMYLSFWDKSVLHRRVQPAVHLLLWDSTSSAQESHLALLTWRYPPSQAEGKGI